MGLTLQLLHVGVFTMLWAISPQHRNVAMWLALSGMIYIFLKLFVFDFFNPYPYGVIVHIIKIAIDLTIINRIHREYTDFSSYQCMVLWAFVGWNVMAAVEFPFLSVYNDYKVDSIVYSSYRQGSHYLNIAQLMIGVGYVFGAIRMVGRLRSFYNSMDKRGGTPVLTKEKTK